MKMCDPCIICVDNENGESIEAPVDCRRPRWKTVFSGYPRDYELGYREGKTDDEKASAFRVSIAITRSPMLKERLDNKIGNPRAVNRGLTGPLAGDNFIEDVTALKDWLSADDIWGKADVVGKISDNKVVKKMNGWNGVIVIERDDGSKYASLWKDNNIVDGEISDSNIVYFWGLEERSEGWILSTGDMVYWYIGKFGNLISSNMEKKFNACSGAIVLEEGKLKDYRNSKYQHIMDKGPTVEGEYKLNLEPDPDNEALSDGRGELARNPDGALEHIPEEFHRDWGYERIRLIPVEVSLPKNEYGNECYRDRASFYFHDSKKGRTNGCIEVEWEFFEMLREYRKQGVKNVRVMVKYPNKNHDTKAK